VLLYEASGTYHGTLAKLQNNTDGIGGGSGASNSYEQQDQESFETGPLVGGYQSGAANGCAFQTGRHTNGSNFLLADGHAKWLRGTQVSAGDNALTTTTAATGHFADGTGNLGPASLAATFSGI
jgi:prepilin-type processing-associated H-X9-DG protein